MVFRGSDKHSSKELPLAHSVNVRFIVIEAVDVAESADHSYGIIVMQFDLSGLALLGKVSARIYKMELRMPHLEAPSEQLLKICRAKA